MGGLATRSAVLGLLQALPRMSAATEDEMLYFVEQRRLRGKGIGYVDAHLLAAAAMHGASLWTRDTRLRRVADEHALAFSPGH